MFYTQRNRGQEGWVTSLWRKANNTIFITRPPESGSKVHTYWPKCLHGWIPNLSVIYTWDAAAAAAAKLLQLCPTLCNPIDGSPPGSPIPGILQARTLEWVAISFSNAWKWKVKVKLLTHVRLLATPWTVAYPAPPSMGFSRQEYWSGMPLPSPIFLGCCIAQFT